MTYELVTKTFDQLLQKEVETISTFIYQKFGGHPYMSNIFLDKIKNNHQSNLDELLKDALFQCEKDFEGNICYYIKNAFDNETFPDQFMEKIDELLYYLNSFREGEQNKILNLGLNSSVISFINLMLILTKL